jgi:hypothetical protein
VREEDLRVLLQRRPCPLLRLHLTTGMIFDITDPDRVVYSRSVVEILLPPEQGRGREAVISLLHIAWIEVVSPPD